MHERDCRNKNPGSEIRQSVDFFKVILIFLNKEIPTPRRRHSETI